MSLGNIDRVVDEAEVEIESDTTRKREQLGVVPQITGSQIPPPSPCTERRDKDGAAARVEFGKAGKGPFGDS